MLYDCPACKNRTMYWDLRCKWFLCLSHGCAVSIPPPKIPGVDYEEIQRLLSWGHLSATKRFIEEYSNPHFPEKPSSQPQLPPANVAPLKEINIRPNAREAAILDWHMKKHQFDQENPYPHMLP